MDVQSIHLPQRLAFLTNGASVPITNLFDAWGDETDDLAEARSYVCGAGREWWSGLLSDFETGRVH